jgi:cytochrome c-type biogenesis protein CcmH/NrfG
MLKLASDEEQSIDDYRVYDTLGNAQFALGHYENALKAYQTALQMAPSNAENLQKIRSYYDLARERI